VLVPVSETALTNVCALLIASVAVAVSTTGALKVLAATTTESVAVPVSAIVLRNVCRLLTASVAVPVSETEESYTPAKEANGVHRQRQ